MIVFSDNSKKIRLVSLEISQDSDTLINQFANVQKEQCSDDCEVKSSDLPSSSTMDIKSVFSIHRSWPAVSSPVFLTTCPEVLYRIYPGQVVRLNGQCRTLIV